MLQQSVLIITLQPARPTIIHIRIQMMRLQMIHQTHVIFRPVTAQRTLKPLLMLLMMLPLMYHKLRLAGRGEAALLAYLVDSCLPAALLAVDRRMSLDMLVVRRLTGAEMLTMHTVEVCYTDEYTLDGFRFLLLFKLLRLLLALHQLVQRQVVLVGLVGDGERVDVRLLEDNVVLVAGRQQTDGVR